MFCARHRGWRRPSTGPEPDPALKVAAYSARRAGCGIFALLPGLRVLGILGLYSLYLLYLGLPC